MPYGRLGELMAGSFGVAAAILLVGGWILLRFQRDRQQFRLMQAALERGVTVIPGAAAGWLISLRQGALALALGAGILGAGKALHRSADELDRSPLPVVEKMSPGEAATMPGQPSTMPGRAMPSPPRDRMGPPDGGGRDWQPPPQPMGPHEGRPPMGMEPPPRQSPALDRAHEVQSRRLWALVSMSAGAILVLLGIVRIAFSFLEKKYAVETAGSAKI